MKIVIIDGKEYHQQELSDIDKLPSMSYPEDLLTRQCLISTTIQPFKLINFANTSQHWSKKRDIKNILQWKFYHPNTMALKQIQLPVVAKIIRISPKTQDYDNFVYNCKCVRDFIADCLIPGKAPGQADNSKNILWEYIQEKGQSKQYALRIEIWKSDVLV